eukprot:XP_022276966.1 TSSK6-activating co-chaperone protein isoform X6 [Canis lupus familiaris]
MTGDGEPGCCSDLRGQEKGWCCRRETLREAPLLGDSEGLGLAPHLLGVQMEQHASHPNEKAKEESNAVPLCRAKPSPSFINLQASSPPATFLNIQRTKLPSEVSFFHGMCRKNWVGM